MTEKEVRERVVNQALRWLGLNEADGSYVEILAAYNAIDPLPVGYRVKNTDPWCAAFVSAVGARCGLTDVLLPECSCARMLEKYRRAGRWVEDDNYTPDPGDLIMYGWNDSGVGDYQGLPDHVGIVERCDGGKMSVIEGNKNNAVERRSIRVGARYIRGFCLPNYAGATGPQKKTGFPDVEAGAWYEDAVKWAAQKGLITGYPDGEFKPEQPLTRAEAAVLLWRQAGEAEA